MFESGCCDVCVKGEETPRCDIFGQGKTWPSPLSAMTGTCRPPRAGGVRRGRAQPNIRNYRSSFFACTRDNPLGSATLASKYPLRWPDQIFGPSPAAPPTPLPTSELSDMHMRVRLSVLAALLKSVCLPARKDARISRLTKVISLVKDSSLS
jgi:hypothetical protein